MGIMAASDQFKVSDVIGPFKAFVFQLFDQVDGVVDAIDDAVFVAVGSFVFGAGLQPYFQCRFGFAVADDTVHDAVVIGIALIEVFAPPPE